MLNESRLLLLCLTMMNQVLIQTKTSRIFLCSFHTYVCHFFSPFPWYWSKCTSELFWESLEQALRFHEKWRLMFSSLFHWKQKIVTTNLSKQAANMPTLTIVIFYKFLLNIRIWYVKCKMRFNFQWERHQPSRIKGCTNLLWNLGKGWGNKIALFFCEILDDWTRRKHHNTIFPELWTNSSISCREKNLCITDIQYVKE